MRLAIDIGGTFTDLVVEIENHGFRLYKSPSVAANPAAGAMAAIELAAQENKLSVEDFLSHVDLLIHGTTQGLNAILTGNVARTGFVTTRGHPDILLFREGGRREPFNNTRRFPPAYVSRRFTYEVTERVASDGRVLIEFDDAEAIRVINQMASDELEAVAVCFLWSIVNPAHERRFQQLLQEHLPTVPCTLSHELNPTIREYRRASSACIDASLKPLIGRYLSQLNQLLRVAGFKGRCLSVTGGGGLLDFDDVTRAPIHSLGSGPAMAPVAGHHFAHHEASFDNLIVADAGGTSYDVSLVRRGQIPHTRESWIGEDYTGHIVGFPSVDVKSIGAGGGSIAWVDRGGLLHVGPESAGADPGPACYGKGSSRPTVTDACLVLGYLNPTNFLGGRIQLDPDAAARSLESSVARPLGLDLARSAAAVLDVVTERMALAVEDVSIRQGVDPSLAMLVAGGGSSGFNCVPIARRIGCKTVLLPRIAAGLSAAGGLLADLTSEVFETRPTSTASFDYAVVNDALARIEARCRDFLNGPAAGSSSTTIEYFAEARYPDQIWELEVALRGGSFRSSEDVEGLRQDFHAAHRASFAVADLQSAVEIITWGARARGRLRQDAALPIESRGSDDLSELAAPTRRHAYFDGGWLECDVYALEAIPRNKPVHGPALIDAASTTLVLPSGASVVSGSLGSLLISPGVEKLAAARTEAGAVGQ